MAIADEARSLAASEEELDDSSLLALEKAADEVARSWSQSNLGYQANVYYKDFQTPPPGAMFSREWGFQGVFLGSTGDWQPFRPEDVVAHIETLAGGPDLSTLRTQSAARAAQVETLVQRARSLAATVAPPHDDYLKENLEALQHVALPDLGTLARAQMQTTSGQFVIRDMQAAEGGWQPAGHQVALANVLHIRSPYAVARMLAQICDRLARHLERSDSPAEPAVVQLGSKVFIGHGGASSEYLKLGVWLTDQGLSWDVFDRKPTAGISTKPKLRDLARVVAR